MSTSIRSCKMYRFNKNREKIDAVLASNFEVMGLAIQAPSELDEKYQTPEYLETKKKEQPEQVEERDMDVDMVDERPHLGGHSGPSFNPNPDMNDVVHIPDSEEELEGMLAHKGSDIDDVPESAPTEDATLEESSAISGMPITASTQCIAPDFIKSSLNSREDTCGVSYVLRKDDEVWVCYQDDINLNNIMSAVIEYLANAGFDTLQFNRLARSDNSIVFEIAPKLADRFA